MAKSSQTNESGIHRQNIRQTIDGQNIDNTPLINQIDKEKGKNKQTIAVIGAGIIGVNCALALQQQGYQVTMFDKSGISEGCSKGNAGHFATEQVFPLADPAILWQLPKLLLEPLGPVSLSPKYFFKVLPWFMRFILNMRKKPFTKNTNALKTLNRSAINYYQPLLKAAGCESLLTLKGSLLVFESTAIEDIEKIHLQYQDAGINVKLLSKSQALLLEPDLHPNISHALYFVDVGHTIEPAKLCFALAEYANQLGAKFLRSNILSVNEKHGKVELSTQQELLTFDKVVIATGAWSKTIMAPLGYKIPIEAERGYHYQLQPHHNLSRPVASAERKFIITPMAETLRLAGTVEYAGLHAKPNYKRAKMLLESANNIIKTMPNQFANQDEQQWVGARPSLPDSLPIIGKAPKHNNIFVATGHQHLGLTLGAITGKLVAQLIAGEKTDIDITPFCLSRFN